MSIQPQFRYTQPPSKVIHLRNLPWECSDEELVEFGKPFGKVVNTKCNVGANKNQAFIEFADLNQAISTISYYASSAEPAQLRGKTVYLQYSNRQEIVNSKAASDVPSNVLLATVEGVDAGNVSIDVLHLVFSAFGFVHKLATFEKTAGFQALVQYSNAEIAATAKNALDGRSIPRYLLPDHISPCTLKITFSAHKDLNVKFQSHRSRDYTNLFLPVAPSAVEGVGQDGMKQEPESNILLVSLENQRYVITVDVLHTVFSAVGSVQKIAIFEKNGAFQALIQFPDIPAATLAKNALQGHCVYEGGFCKLQLTYSRHTDLNVKVNNERGKDYTISSPSTQPSILGPQPMPMPILPAGAPPYKFIPSYPPVSGLMMPPCPVANQMTAAPPVSGNPIHAPSSNMIMGLQPGSMNQMMGSQPPPHYQMLAVHAQHANPGVASPPLPANHILSSQLRPPSVLHGNLMMAPPPPGNMMMAPRPAAAWDVLPFAQSNFHVRHDSQYYMQTPGGHSPSPGPMMSLPAQGSQSSQLLPLGPPYGQ